MESATESCASGVAALVDNLESLVNDQETADVVFVVGRQEVAFYAHKLLLWARCESFQNYQQQFWRSRSSLGPLTFKYPQYDPSCFAEILRYIYTGKILLKSSTVFSILLLSQDFGIKPLRLSCERFLESSLTVDNACHMLATALAMRAEHPELQTSSDGSSFVSACERFIYQHAEGCTQTEGWLELPKTALVNIIRSDDFALEEEHVWKAVLGWAKYHAGVPLEKKPLAWNSHEKALISQALDGIVEHIKLLLIDSSVFAEEVEPTGLVSMETSLEKYRLAAVPDKMVEQAEDKRLQPRVNLQFFQETTILSKDRLQYQRLLNQWYGKQKQKWLLLYRASRDGFSAESFHECCDGKGPTYVIVTGSTGSVCGGFTDVPWTSNTSTRGRFIPSHRSFLFTLVNNQGVPPSKFDVTNSKFATIHHPSFGPVFGAGADLCIADNCQSGMESYSNMPHSYGGPNASCSILMGDYNFSVTDYEVFTTAAVDDTCSVTSSSSH